MNKKEFIKSDKIGLGQILMICVVILGFALTLTSFFKDSNIIIFWLIMLPFGIEAIIVSVANAIGRYEKIAETFLIICLFLLFIALIVLFSFNVFPKFEFLSKNISKIVTIIFGIFILIIFPIFSAIMNMKSERYLSEYKYQFLKSFSSLEEKIKNHIGWVATIFDNSMLMIVVEKSFGQQISKCSCPAKRFLGERIKITKEKMVLITDSQDRLIDIIKHFEEGKNEILGVIVVNFKPTDDQKVKLKSYGIEWEECFMPI